MRRHGIGADVVTALAAVSRAYRGWGGSAPVTQRLHDGGELEFAGRTFEVLHRPGPLARRHRVLRRRRTATLIAGDHLIKNISSNPLIAPRRCGGPEQRPRALLTYLESLRATQRDAGRDRAARATATSSATTRR